MGKKALVIGDVMIDRTGYGRVEKISPEAPIPVIQMEYQVDTIGGAGNVARNIKQLSPDTEVCLSGAYNDTVLKLLEQDKIIPYAYERVEIPNVKLRYVDIKTGYQLLRDDNEESSGIYNKKLLKDYNTFYNLTDEIAKHFDIIVISDYKKGWLTEAHNSLIRKAREAGVPVVADTRDLLLTVKGSTLVTPNRKEFDYMMDNSGALSRTEFMRWFKNNGIADYLLLTKSEDGMELYHSVEENNAMKLIKSAPALANSPVDVTGAGDTVVATYAVGILNKIDMKKLVDVASKTARDVCLQKGTAVPTQKIESYL
jgi:rfaE bifunctional protein kinase chain/domain